MSEAANALGLGIFGNLSPHRTLSFASADSTHGTFWPASPQHADISDMQQQPTDDVSLAQRAIQHF